jgi:hypothetical protein
MHKPIPTFFLALALALACAVAASGCASKADMDARYEASLQRWRGATLADLEAAWGQPRLAQGAADGQVLTWVVRVDADDVHGAAPDIAVTHTSNGGVTSTPLGMGALAPAQVPITCTTHFTIRDARVVSWKFEGLGCGAPT